MRPTEQGLEREINAFKMAQNDSNGLARSKNFSRIQSVIVGIVCHSSTGRGKCTCVNVGTECVCPTHVYLLVTEKHTCLHTTASA